MAAVALEVASLFNVAGKRVLVTGGGRGIGHMIARTFVRNGAHVLIASRNAAATTAAAAALNDEGRESGGSCAAVGGSVDLGKDVSECEKLAAAVATAAHFNDELDVLVNNSGVTWGEPFEQYNPKGFDKVMNVNVRALFYTTKACLPMLERAAERQGPARVINIGSIVGIRPQAPPTFAYDASKAAVHQLTKQLAMDFAARRITVNAIAPGLVPSKMSRQLNTYTEEGEQFTTPLGRLGATHDMGGIALLLASQAGEWITGAVIPVDGGALVARWTAPMNPPPRGGSKVLGGSGGAKL